ncbi:MAG: HDIG domain-containing protein [Methanomicrobiales archaeon]|nr:HDIG domain-containing protein [Methanomicrobiales archaeon]
MHKDAGFFEGLLAREGCNPKVIAHCRTVNAIAMEYVQNGSPADPDLVLAGSMLHDIGRSRTHSIGHAQAGAAICRGLGQPEAVARIVECHTGAGLTADECTLLGLLPIDCMPVTLEEKILTNADNLAGGKRRISIEHDLMDAFALPRKVRKRMFRLWLEMELFRE